MTAVSAAPVAIAARTGPDRRWLGLFAILAGCLMDVLDTSIVNVAAPAIHRDLGGDYTALQWLTAGYTLAIAAGMLTGGRLGDMYGRRRMLMIGTAGFMVTSVLCTLSPTAGALIGTRVLQGLCAAIMVPQGFGLIRDLFGAEMGKAFSLYGPCIGLSIVAAPVVAGTLVDANLFGTGWRMIFLINLPLGGFSLLAGRISLPTRAAGAARPARLDVSGALLAGLGMFLLTFPLVQGRELGWPGWSFAMLGVSVPVLGLFGWLQTRKSENGLLEMSVFRKRSYVSGVVFVMVFFGTMAGLSLVLGLFLQLGRGYSPTGAALMLSGWPAGGFVGSALGGTFGAKLGRRILHVGLTFMGVGTLWMYLTFHGHSTSLWLPTFVYGLGMGAVFMPMFDITIADVEDHEVGSGSAALEAVQQLAASMGVAVLGTIFFSRIGHGFAAAEPVTLLALALTAVAFALAFLMPRTARAHG
jgi:EmrB/QacA subfamily drug resistance transporter